MKRLLLLVTLLFTQYSLAAEQSHFQVMLAKQYKHQSVKGWLASEKLDGVRGYWDGKSLMSRNGNIFHAPKSFIAGFPPFALDGELYIGRGRFTEVSGKVRRIHEPDWSEIHYHIFDVPHAEGGLLTRLQLINDWLHAHPTPSIIVIPQTPIDTIDQAQHMREHIESQGGEGVMLRNPDTPYISARSDTMLKLKKSDDAECTVTEHHTGNGKYAEKMGAISCQLSSGTIIKIGTGFNDNEREIPPAIGTVITFKYNGLTKHNKPRFPRFWRIRTQDTTN